MWVIIRSGDTTFAERLALEPSGCLCVMRALARTTMRYGQTDKQRLRPKLELALIESALRKCGGST